MQNNIQAILKRFITCYKERQTVINNKTSNIQ